MVHYFQCRTIWWYPKTRMRVCARMHSLTKHSTHWLRVKKGLANARKRKSERASKAQTEGEKPGNHAAISKWIIKARSHLFVGWTRWPILTPSVDFMFVCLCVLIEAIYGGGESVYSMLSANYFSHHFNKILVSRCTNN